MIRPTTFIEASRLERHLGVELLLASETFQQTGSFKFRAAYNLVSKVPQKLILTASSGNFGQAVALACKLLNKSCIVVMPSASARTKIAAVQEHGGLVEIIDVKQISRAARVAELAKEHPEAYVASAYDDPLVIEGNATLGRELSKLEGRVDCFLAPVGGGGLTSGIISGLRQCDSRIPVVGVEPQTANDAARSLKAGHIVRNEREPETLADGVRTVSLGDHNWKILQGGLQSIVEVPEAAIAEGVRLLFNFANLKAEPTGALAIAALLANPEQFKGKRVCAVISGANVDPELFSQLISGGDSKAAEDCRSPKPSEFRARE